MDFMKYPPLEAAMDYASPALSEAKSYFIPLLQQVKDGVNSTSFVLSNYVLPYHDDLRKIHQSAHYLPEPWLLVGHCAFVACLFSKRPFRDYWMLSFWLAFTAGFGGGTIANILTGDPPAWLKVDEIMFTFAICWWLVTYFPLTRPIFNSYPVKLGLKICSNILRSRIIYSRCDVVVKQFGASAIVAPLFLGTIAGCGGKLLCDFGTMSFHLNNSYELAKPSWSLRSAFGTALFYMSTVHWFKIFPHDITQAIIITVLVGQGLASDLSGIPFDLTSPFSKLLHLVTFIPEPTAAVPSEAGALVKESLKTTKKKKTDMMDHSSDSAAPTPSNFVTEKNLKKRSKDSKKE